MSEASRDLGASAEPNTIGPDYFTFYAREVAKLLSHDEDFLPFSSETAELAGRTCGVVGDKDERRLDQNDKKGSICFGSLFCNSIGARLSDCRKERLNALLRQSVVPLSQEVDEMLDPVFAICRIQSHLRYRESLPNNSAAASEGDKEQHPQKKIKLSSSIDVPPSDSTVSAEGNDDMQLILENDSVEVRGAIKKHSDELSKTLGHMERQLEEMLDTILSNCRLMTLAEKKQLQTLIKKLPPRNLDRVVEIIQWNKPSEKYSSNEIRVDLEKEDNVTLWRLYYYVEAVENAKKLPR